MKINLGDFEKLSDIFKLLNLVCKSTFFTTDPAENYELDQNYYEYNIIQMSEVVELDLDFDIRGLFLIYKDMEGDTHAIMHFGEFTFFSKEGVLND